LFATQIVNNLLDAERPSQPGDVADDKNMIEPEELGTHIPDPESETGELPEQDDGPDGTQYDENSYKE